MKIEVKCDLDNELDESLNAGRLDAKNHGIAYDADMWFSIFLDDTTCIRCCFDLYGLEVHHCFSVFEIKDKQKRESVLTAINVICEHFADKTLDDISESFYREVESALKEKLEIALKEIL